MLLAVVGAVAHLNGEYAHWLVPEQAAVSFFNVFSLCALVVVILLLISTLYKTSLFQAGLIALPIAALILLSELMVSAPASLLDGSTTGLAVHIVTSVIAFGLFCIAGVYALFTTLIDYLLRHKQVNRLLTALPSLEVLEKLLFHFISAGFVLLTISLITGLLFVNNLFAQHLVHKTVLSLIAWVLFAVLLWGRWRYGWRGRTAVRMTLLGTGFLLLSYFGSKLVLELILGRSWQS